MFPTVHRPKVNLCSGLGVYSDMGWPSWQAIVGVDVHREGATARMPIGTWTLCSVALGTASYPLTAPSVRPATI